MRHMYIAVSIDGCPNRCAWKDRANHTEPVDFQEERMRISFLLFAALFFASCNDDAHGGSALSQANIKGLWLMQTSTNSQTRTYLLNSQVESVIVCFAGECFPLDYADVNLASCHGFRVRPYQCLCRVNLKRYVKGRLNHRLGYYQLCMFFTSATDL